MTPEAELSFIFLVFLGCIYMVALIASKFLEMRCMWQYHKLLMEKEWAAVPVKPTVDLGKGEHAWL